MAENINTLTHGGNGALTLLAALGVVAIIIVIAAVAAIMNKTKKD